MKKNITNSGMSLIEILVVVLVFAILGIIITGSIISTLQGSKKSESTLKVRESVDYAVSVMERQLRNSNSILNCPFTDQSSISYTNEVGILASFSCEEISSEEEGWYIASDSARLTNTDIIITSCKFSCEASDSIPSVININLTAKNAGTGVERSQIDITTQIQLRTY